MPSHLLVLALIPLAWPPGSWIEGARLTADNPATRDQHGYSVSLWHRTAVVGMPGGDPPTSGLYNSGAAFVYERGGDGWNQVAKLLASDGAAYDEFGESVAVSGNAIVVGAIGDTEAGGQGAGAAYVFRRSGVGSWAEEAKLMASDGGALYFFGNSVAIDGDTLVVGAPQTNGLSGSAQQGAAYVFERVAGGQPGWIETRKLYASNGTQNQRFGVSVAISGDAILVGEGQWNSDAAFVFERDRGGAGAWGQTATLTDGSGAGGMAFGHTVSLHGDTAVVGAAGDSHSGVLLAGSSYVFQRDPQGTWSRAAKLTALDPNYQDKFGASVAVFADTILVGASTADVNNTFLTGDNAGAAYVFQREADDVTSWREIRRLTANDAKPNDFLGGAVALSSDAALVGAYNDDHSGVPDAGSALVFERLPACSNCATFCAAGSSASGCQATLTAHGEASAGASDGFLLSVWSVEGGKNGRFFYGTNGRQSAPWGNGSSLFCLVPPVQRTKLLSGVGPKGACDGYFTFDLNSFWSAHPLKNPGAGALVQAQFWYRDQGNTSNVGTSLSNAVEFRIEP